ncbi:unnamed protein product, partial [Meganyctiphanes norvegica]
MGMGRYESVPAPMEIDARGGMFACHVLKQAEWKGGMVTIFVDNQPPVLGRYRVISQDVKASRVLRHPGLLKYIDGGIMGGEVVVVTEYAKPLQHYDLGKLSPLHVSGGLLSILQTLVFMHDR